MEPNPHDPRAIANLILCEGERLGRPVTNLALQKLLYFAHAIYLVQTKRPLVSGYFEAWTYGPVHPTVYHAFKAAGDRPITFRAAGKDALTGENRELAVPEDPKVKEHVCAVMAYYGRMTPGRLVDVAHAKGAPWDYIVDKGRTTVVLGLRIPDNVILARFKHHKVSVSGVPNVGEPGDDTPLA